MKSGGNYATALRKLITVLRKVEPTFDISTIERLAGECNKIPTKSPEWTISLNHLSFPAKTFKEGGLDHVRPRAVTANKYKVVLSVEASGRLPLANEDDDPIQHLAVNVVVTEMPGSQPESIFCAWHLDSHPPPPKRKEGETSKKDEEESGKDKESSFAHPRYHWQYGGKKVWESNNEDFFGSHLLLESPRLPHPPLDVVLAIDFVFSNYYGKQWRKLRDETEYQRIVKEAQERYWRPYFNAIQMNWSRGSSTISPIKLMPFFY
ncbi:MAG TPA: hypothetical protein VF598_03555 [Hymenobacter sp.]|jgi:hypothetical protein